MNIVNVEARNIQGLQWARVEPKATGATIIGGKNRAGKTSLLNALAWTLGGEKLCPEHPIRDGEETANCIVELNGDPARMLPACIVTRTWKKNSKGEEVSALTIKTVDGFKAASPQTILDTVIGTLGFEPEAFLRANEKDQVKILRELVGLDFTALDAEFKEVFAERTKLNSTVKSIQAQFEAKPFHKDAPEKEVSVTELMAELAAREKMATENAERRRTLHDIECDVRELEEAVAEAERQLEAARKRLETRRNLAEGQRVACAALVDPNVEEIRQQITEADAVNRKVRDNAERQKLVAYHQELTDEATAKTKRLDEINTEKATKTAAAQWPIEGLGFNENGVTFQGRELRQASKMEQIQTAVAIRAALNPTLQFAFISDGALLDDEQLAKLAEFADEKNLQLFIERVGAGSECDLVIKDGRIVGQEEPVVEAKPVKSKKAKSGELALEA